MMEKLGLLLEPTISFNPGAPKLGKRVWVLALDWLLPVRKLEDPGFLTSPCGHRLIGWEVIGREKDCRRLD